MHEIADENIFLSSVSSAWTNVTHNLETQITGKTILWNNKDITSNNKTFFYKHWFEKNIKYVDQLYDYRIKDFYSFENICYIYGIPSGNFLMYYTLIKSIPIHIKSTINTNNTPCTQTSFTENILAKQNETNKIFYKLQIKHPAENSKIQNKWQSLLREQEFNWKQIFIMPYKTTIDSTLRNFQYKYVHRIIATNKYLFKCNLSNTNLCDICSEHIETIEHLFWECKHIQTLWNQLTTFLEKTTIKRKLSLLNISFGVNTFKIPEINNTVNHIIILMKYFIFSFKYKKQIPTFNCFINYLKLKIQIEKEIALNNDKLHIFEQKWKRINFHNPVQLSST